MWSSFWLRRIWSVEPLQGELARFFTKFDIFRSSKALIVFAILCAQKCLLITLQTSKFWSFAISSYAAARNDHIIQCTVFFLLGWFFKKFFWLSQRHISYRTTPPVGFSFRMSHRKKVKILRQFDATIRANSDKWYPYSLAQLELWTLFASNRIENFQKF